MIKKGFLLRCLILIFSSLFIISFSIHLEATSPKVYSITPNTGSISTSTQITIKGSGFESTPKVSIYGGGPYITGSCNTPCNAIDIHVQGKYAYIVMYYSDSDLYVMDISDPENPVIVGSYDTPGQALSVYVQGTYAYVADGGWKGGLQVIDVSDPINPSIVGSCDTVAEDVYVQGTYAYVADGGWKGGLQVIDINDPISPNIVGSCDTVAEDVYVQDTYAYVVDGDEGLQVIDISNPEKPGIVGSCYTLKEARNIYVTGTYAYVADGQSGLQVIDISNPEKPSIVGSCDTPGKAYDVYAQGTYAYVGTKLSGFHVIDISDPEKPSVVSFCDVPGRGGDVGVYVTKTNAYVVCKSSGLHVIDIGNLENPSIVSSCNTPGSPRDLYVTGTYAYVADYGSGLQVIDISDPVKSSIVGFCDTPDDARDVYIRGTYAYIADWTSFQVIDISNPKKPSIVGFCDTPDYSMAVYVSGNYAYVANRDTGLQVIDIANPKGPNSVGSCKMPGSASDVYVTGIYAYVADSELGLHVIDIRKPSFPYIVGSCRTPGYASGIYVIDTYAYVADSGAGFQVIDISDTENPRIIGSCDIPEYARDVYITNTYAYVVGIELGLHVIDISNPITPYIVGSCSTPGFASGIYVSDSYPYVAEEGSGLLVIDKFKLVTDTIYLDSNTLTATVPAGYRLGIYDLYLTNPNGGNTVVHNAFTISCTDLFFYRDQDNDGYGLTSDVQCLTSPGGEYTTTYDGDCDDTDPNTYPGASEKCDGIDNDCDGVIDDPNGLTYSIFYFDSDGDGYGDLNKSQYACKQPLGYVINSEDCIDTDKNVYPGAVEVYDGKDNNCNGQVDEEDFHMILPAGWSMISIPLIPANALVSELFPDAIVVYYYKKGVGYVRVKDDEVMEVGRGYWILLDKAQTYIIIGRTIERYNLPVQDGWYMIGGCTYPTQTSVDNGNIVVIYEYVQDVGYQRVLKSENLAPGKGYWILFNDITHQAYLTVGDIFDEIPNVCGYWAGTWEAWLTDPNVGVLTDPNGKIIIAMSGDIHFHITDQNTDHGNMSVSGTIEVTGWDVEPQPQGWPGDWTGESDEVALDGWIDLPFRYLRARYFYYPGKETFGDYDANEDPQNIKGIYTWFFNSNKLKITNTDISGQFSITGTEEYYVIGVFSVISYIPR